MTSKVKWNQVDKLVWVKVGKTEHQAHLLEKDVASSTCRVLWVTTNKQEVVDSSTVIFYPPSKRSRRKTNLVSQEKLAIPNLACKESLATPSSLQITPPNSVTSKVKWNQVDKLV